MRMVLKNSWKEILKKNNKLKIELAGMDLVDSLAPYINKVIKAIGHPEALVTDESLVWDFLNVFDTKEKSKQLKRLNIKMGFKVNEDDFVWQVAEKLKNVKKTKNS